MIVLVLQHHAAEHPSIFRDFLVEDGHEWDAVQLQRGDPLPALADYDALWVMGGPMDVWDETRYPWLAPEKHFLREAVFDRRMPFLGFCLGHQLLAEIAGGDCRKMDTPEIGIYPVELTAAGRGDRLFADIPARFEALQWHGVAVTRVPDDVAVLAHSPAAPIQAIRVGEHAWGLQCHIEATPSTIDEWAAIPEYAQALEQLFASDPVAQLRHEATIRMEALRGNARCVYDNFMSSVR